ncbi:MAG TPA: DNA recombination protein RmuC [Caulobacteraceae bacterium]|nr:DNA recombination protein RmuC [Caulobacteraceae bacterium]
MNASMILAVLALGLGGGLAWALRALFGAQASLAASRTELAVTQTQLVALKDQLAAAGAAAPAAASQAAQLAADEMIKRAAETFKPVSETLAKFQEQVAAVEKIRAEDAGGLKAQIAALMQASVQTQAEARKLSAALRRGAGVQGRWGEQTLRNVLEAAGLAKRFDFQEQVSLEAEEGRRRPDVTVRMPGCGVFVIDAKCSLNAFLDAQDALDDAAREAAMVRHAQSVRAHMTGLSSKAYWDQFPRDRSPDFVAMFVPGDGFLAAALDNLPELMSEAMERRVVLVTPTTLFALCKAIAYGWRVEEQAANADQIATLGRELYKRLSVMGEHVAGLGKALGAAVGRYNAFVGSLESQVLTQARRFEELAVDHQAKSIETIEPLESAVRAPVKLAAGVAGPDDAPQASENPPILTVQAG